MIRKICPTCKKKFRALRKKQIYCCSQCVRENSVYRKKMSEKNKGKKRSKETCKKISEALKGKILSEQHRKNISKAQMGRVQPKGKESPNWKGGTRMVHGYITIYCPNHPSVVNSDKKYVREHRLVMEKHLGRYLYHWEEIHHINGIKTDNRLENLKVVSLNNHYGKIKCPKCNFEFLIK